MVIILRFLQARGRTQYICFTFSISTMGSCHHHLFDPIKPTNQLTSFTSEPHKKNTKKPSLAILLVPFLGMAILVSGVQWFPSSYFRSPIFQPRAHHIIRSTTEPNRRKIPVFSVRLGKGLQDRVIRHHRWGDLADVTTDSPTLTHEAAPVKSHGF